MIRIACAAVAAVLLSGPSLAAPRQADGPNMLTQGMVSMTLKVGQTSQYEVLQTFGGPNVSTLDGAGNEVWVYDRHATVSYDKSSGFSIGMLAGAGGGGAGVGGGFGFGSSKSKNQQSSRTMMLIIKFGPDKRVIDFQSRSSSF